MDIFMRSIMENFAGSSCALLALPSERLVNIPILVTISYEVEELQVDVST
jgi:hypothetical protein